jgi:propionate CoA-transferase
MVELFNLKGEEWLFYKTPKKISVALLRGTTADTEGNVVHFF